jgi:alpha-ribazole phosphatase
MRTEQTFFHIYGLRPHRKDARLREMDFGAFALRSYEELKNDPAYLEWISGDNEAKRCPGGESGLDMKLRVYDALEGFIKGGRNVLAVVHGGVIAAVMQRCFPDEGKNRYQWQPKAGEGYTLFIDGGKFSYSEIS